MGYVPAPPASVHIQLSLITGFFPVAVRSCFPIEGVDFIMGNDIADGKVCPVPEVTNSPILQSESDDLAQHHTEVFPVCVLTRAWSQKQAQDVNLSDSLLVSALSEDMVLPAGDVSSCAVEPEVAMESEVSPGPPLPLTRDALIDAQKNDPSLAKCFDAVMVVSALEMRHF